MKKRIIAVALTFLTVIAFILTPLIHGAVRGGDIQFKNKLRSLGVPTEKVDHYNSAIKQASAMTRIDKELIAALIHSESTFNEFAESGTGYFGAMQIPYKIFDIRKNVLMGTFILEDKIRGAGGNLTLALTRYKGWREHKKGVKQANAVLTLYKRLQEA